MRHIFLALGFIFLFSGAVYGASITVQSSPYPGTIDFDDYYAQKNTTDYGNSPYTPPAGETVAQHNQMGLWQRLGTVNDNTDGVTWSVGGSEFGTTATLYTGEEVTFKFDFWQSNTGTHDYDQIISFLDWNQDGVWTSDMDVLWQDSPTTSETILYEKVDAVKNSNNDYQYDNDYISANSSYTSFFVTFTVPEDAILGTTWLRTRVHCWHVTYPNITAYGNLNGQGETLDVQLTIASNEVPEPTTLLLFGAGLIGIASRVRRKK